MVRTLIISLNNTSNYVIITSNYMLNFINSSKNNKWSSNLYNNMIYYNDYNVGIGTNNPQSKLHLYNDVSNSTSFSNAKPSLPYNLPSITSLILSLKSLKS